MNPITKNIKHVLRVGLTVSILILSLSLTSKGQNAPGNLEVFLKPTVNSDGVQDSINSSATPYNVVFVLSLSDTSGIKNLHVKLGSTPGGTEKASFVMPFKANGNGPPGITYKRKNNKVYIGCGLHTDMQNYHAEVKCEGVNGNIGPAAKHSK